MATKKWTMTNGDARFDMDVCNVCVQPYRSGHVDCSCHQNHPENCNRPTYSELSDQLIEARRVSGDNADIAMKAIGMLAETQEMLTRIIESADNDGDLYITIIPDHVLEPARTLIDKQKAEKLI